MPVRLLAAAAHTSPDARPRAGAGVTASLVSLDRRTAVDAWVVGTGQRVAGTASTSVGADGTWSLDLYPNDQLATPDGVNTAWLIKVAGYTPVLIQMPSGVGAADFYSLAAAQTPLDAGEVAALATHLADATRHLPEDGAIGEALVMGVAGPEWSPAAPGGGNPGDYLQTALRLAEFSTPEARAAARANLELQAIDCGTFN